MKPERIQFAATAVADGGTVAIVESKYRFASPHQAINFVDAVSEVAMNRNRYPEIRLYVNVVTVRLATSKKSDLTRLVDEASDTIEGLI